MKSFWQFYQIVENETPPAEDYYIGKLNFTCLFNKMKDFFLKEVYKIYTKYKIKIQNKEHADWEISNLDRDFKDVEDLITFNKIPSAPRISEFLGHIETPNTNLYDFFRIFSYILNKEELESTYGFFLDIDEKGQRIIGDIFNRLHNNRYKKAVTEFILQCKKIEEVDWRPNETVPEDYYAL